MSAKESASFLVRSARIEDAASMIAVLNPIIEAGTHTIMQETLTEAEQSAYVRDFPKRGVFQVAVATGSAGSADPDAPTRILGLQSVEPLRSSSPETFAHVGDISTFVALDAHGLGVGRALSRATIGAARENGFRKLMASVRADNRSAVTFYENVGFRIIGTARKHALVRGAWIDEVLLERFLSDDKPGR